MTKTVEYTHHQTVNSSALTDAWYNEDTTELYVKFKNSGTIAGYGGVPRWEFDDLVTAYSVGAAYSHLKNHGGYRTLNGNVKLVAKTVPAPVATASSVVVRVEVSGTLDFISKPGTDATAWLSEVTRLLNEVVVDGNFKVKELVQKF